MRTSFLGPWFGAEGFGVVGFQGLIMTKMCKVFVLVACFRVVAVPVNCTQVQPFVSGTSLGSIVSRTDVYF